MTTKRRNRAPGDGTIGGPRADGRYYARLPVAPGKQKWLYGKSHAEVQRKLTAAKRDRDRGVRIDQAEQRLDTFLRRWLETIKPPARSQPTWHRYEVQVRVHLIPGLGALRLSKLNGQVIAEYQAHLLATMAPATARLVMAVLRMALADAERWGLIARNPTTGVRRPRTSPRKPPQLTAARMLAILDAFRGHSWEVAVALGVTYGLREGEVLGLRWADIDRTAGTLTIRVQVGKVAPTFRQGEPLELRLPKSRRTRTLPLMPHLVPLLDAQARRVAAVRVLAGRSWQERDLLFPGSTGGLTHPSTLYRAFQQGLVAAQLPAMRFHDLRHGASNLMRALGVPPEIRMAVLGHTTLDQTIATYTDVVTDEVRKALIVVEKALNGSAQSVVEDGVKRRSGGAERRTANLQ